jgi:uncharacterized membrane protein YphA (DoxX/SURF4 family)
MDNLRVLYNRTEARITPFLGRYSIAILRVCLGIVFFWFGILKFFPGMSPAQELATFTIDKLTFGLIPPNISIIILAIWETGIGLCLITGLFLPATLFLMFVQMMGTMTPLFLFPAETFIRFPYAPTLEGQYILKNLVLISAGLVVGATVRGGHIVEEKDDDRASIHTGNP